MGSPTVGVRELKANLSAVLRRVKAGTTVVITDRGTPVGRIVPERASLDAKDLNGAKAALRATVSIVDKMATKAIIHRNTAGRYKSRLGARVSKASA